MLSGQEAAFQVAGLPTKVVGGLKAIIAAKASPVSALSMGERPGLFSPLRQFNGNMRDAFAGVVPQPANLDMGIAPPQPAPAPVIGGMVSAVAQKQQ